MKRANLDNVLEILDFTKKSCSTTLFFTSKEYSFSELFFEERLILDRAKKLKASAVYFRRFPDNQSSKPQLFIFDNTQKSFSSQELADIHRKIWSSGIVPVYYVFDNTNINIFDARKHVDYNAISKTISVNPFACIPIIAGSLGQYQKYSAQLFSNGTFWEQKEFENQFLSKESSENKLIEGLKRVRAQFINDSGLKHKLAHQLLVLSILVKYLEERKDDHGNHVFPANYFKKYKNSSSFCEVLRAGEVVELFDDLSAQFNGKIFELTLQDRNVLINTNLSNLASYLDANSDNGQLVIWPLYSFEFLPVELISRIYEEFIDQRDDAVYTPVHLARLMVDECMPIAEPKPNFRIIDVSCGSGIFLVSVFKRLVQWWQKEQFDRTGKLEFPKIEDLKDILRNSIFGVDIEEASVRLSVFSLSIALCDMLKPTEIWMNLRFDDLRERNIYEGNFFKYLDETEKDQFDLVIGNPPFEDKIKDFDKLLTEFNIKSEYHIPRNQIALLFLQQAMKLLKPGGLLSFVMPSGPLLYNNTLEYRKEFFSRYEIPQIIDLSELRNASILFERTISTAVLFAYNTKPKDDHNIIHITVKRTKTSKEQLFFEIDDYDMHSVSLEVAKNDLKVWKSNLMGGNQLYYLVNRFDQFKKLGKFLEDKRRNSGWYFGEGYHYGDRIKLGKHLTGHRLVESKMFTEKGILGTIIETSYYFGRTRENNRLIFHAPHLLIKEILGEKRFITELVEYDLIFKNRIVGIHSPEKERQELIRIQDILLKNYDLFKLFILASSAEAGINRSGGYVIYMKDILNLPFPDEVNDLIMSNSEEIIKNDVLTYKLEELTKGERAIINTRDVFENELEAFAKVFCDCLNPIYGNDGRQFKALAPIRTLSYTCFPFIYGKQGFSPEISSKIKEGDLSGLIENQKDSVHYHRILRLYQKDIVFLVKPNTLRYWLKSIALRDASDVMIDLVNSGF
jgi:SAM-dependent methyltransferase